MAVPLSSFYPYGTLYDSNLGPNYNSLGQINLAQPFVFFGVNYSVIYVSDYVREQLLYTSNYISDQVHTQEQFYEKVYTRTN